MEVLFQNPGGYLIGSDRFKINTPKNVITIQ